MAEQIAARSGACLHVTAWACRRAGTMGQRMLPLLTCPRTAAAGGTASVTVTTSAGCNWTAASNDSFITITSGASGSGNGTVNYSVAANTSSLSRNGSMTIAGLKFSVSQAGTGGTC